MTPPSRYYFFRNRHSGLVLGIRGASGDAGTPAVQSGQNGSADQVFLAVRMLNGHYLLCTNTATLALGIANAAATAGAEVVQARPSGARDQRFSIDYSGGQSVRLQGPPPGSCWRSAAVPRTTERARSCGAPMARRVNSG